MSFSDAFGGWSQYEQHGQFDQNQPPFKKPRNSDEYQSNSVPPQSGMPNAPVNKGPCNIFYKTRMCVKFRMGTCRNGENCNFAHGIEDLRQPPPNWQELIDLRDEDHRSSSSGNWEDDRKIIHRMKLCKKFYNGEECPYGERCNFLHEDPRKFRDDYKRPRETSVISIGTTGMAPVQGGGSNHSEGNRPWSTGQDACRANSKPVHWKTRLCTKWEMTRQCPFGEKCHFAHGQAELQVPVGGTESEACKPGPIPVKSQLIHTDDVPTSMTVPISFTNEERQGKKCLLKWKGQKKINHIYADWLDDVPLPNIVPKAEN